MNAISPGDQHNERDLSRRASNFPQVALSGIVRLRRSFLAVVTRRNEKRVYQVAGARMILYGMPSAKADSLRSATQVSAELFVPAPVSGTVTSRAVNAGEVVDAGKELLRITDLSTVWVIAQVFERDVTRLRVGSGASVTSDAFPDGIFRGQITYIDPQFDNATRTGKVRIELANPGQALKLGMYVNAAFGALGDAERTSPVIPAGAVQRIDDHDVVFVPTDDQGVFALRPVRLGPEVDGRRVVQEGLAVGDRIVTNGSFLLRAAWLKAR